MLKPAAEGGKIVASPSFRQTPFYSTLQKFVPVKLIALFTCLIIGCSFDLAARINSILQKLRILRRIFKTLCQLIQLALLVFYLYYLLRQHHLPQNAFLLLSCG